MPRKKKLTMEERIRKDTLSSYLSSIGSDCFALNTMERLRIFHDFYRPGEEDKFSFDLKDTLRKGHDPKDYICPNSVVREDDYLIQRGYPT